MTQFATNIPYEATQVDRALRAGDPAHGWKGDARLELRIGVVEMGGRTGRRYEVWRRNEDGTNTALLQRKLQDWHTIIPKLVEMDPRTPGHVPTMDRVEKANKIEHKARADDIKEAHGEHMEHLWSILQERTAGRLTHRQVGGSDERPDRNLAK